MRNRSLRILLPLNFCIYVALLIARGWGAHRMLHYEETIAVGSALSQNFFLSLNDWSYGTLLPRVLVTLAVQFPLEYLPIILFSIATLLWAIYALVIFNVVYSRTNRYFVAFLASLVLILVPLPELGMQGIVWNSFWPMFVALAVVVAGRAYGNSLSGTIGASLFAFLTSASIPIAGVLLVLVGLDFLLRKRDRKKISAVGLSLLAGMVFSLFIHLNQEPPLRYLGEWTQELAQTSETFGRHEDSGSASIREAPPIDFVGTIRSIPGTTKYLLTQMSPEPYASRWILSQGSINNIRNIIFLFGIFFAIPLIAVLVLGSKSENSKTLIIRLGALFVLVLALQTLLIGGILQTRQLLFALVCIYWIAIVLIVPRKSELINSGRILASIGVVTLLVIFSVLVRQTFRDPFDAIPRQGGMGRYEDDLLWHQALEKARYECEGMSPNELIIISQKNEVWVDAPLVVRCGVLKK